MPTAILDIKKKYGEMLPARTDFLEWAQNAADLTIHTLRPKGERESTRPYSQLGGQAVRSLGATLHRVTMPPQVKWVRLAADPDVLDTIGPQPAMGADGLETTVGALLDARFAVLENYILQTLAEFKAKSRTASAMRRNVVEGNTAFCVDKEGLRYFPLRRFVNFRESGELMYMIYREELAPTDGTTPDTRQESDKGNWLYTLVDWYANEVWQYSDDTERAEQVNADPIQYGVFVGSVPDIDQYATSYTYDHLGLIQELNHIAERYGEAMSAAAWNVPLIRPGSNLTPDDLAAHPSGKPLIADADDLSWFSSAAKFGDWSHIREYRNQLREELASLFALGIKDRVTQASSATEVLQIAGELDTHTQDLLSGYEETLQRPLVEAIMHVRGYDQVELPGAEKPFTVTITTGQNALQRETSFTRLVNTATSVQQLDPEMGVHGPKLMKIGAAAQQFEVDDDVFYKRAAPTEGGPAGAPGQTVPLDGEITQTAGGPQTQGGAPQPAEL